MRSIQHGAPGVMSGVGMGVSCSARLRRACAAASALMGGSDKGDPMPGVRRFQWTKTGVTSTLDTIEARRQTGGMTSKLDRQDRSEGDRARARAYHREFWPGIVAYAVVLTGVLLWGDLDGQSPWRFLWAVLPVIPALWLVRAVLRHGPGGHHYQRLQQLPGWGSGLTRALIDSVGVA